MSDQAMSAPRQAPVSSTKAPWSLSFLSGPLFGRTLALKLGENWVGSGAQCDVIVPDRDIAPRQLRLSVGQIAVSIQNVGGGEATLNGAALDATRRALRHGDVVEIGPLKLGIVPAAEPRTVAAPDAPSPSRGRLARWAAAPWAAWMASRRFVIGLGVLWGVLVLAGGAYLAIGATDPFWFQASATERMREVRQALHDYPELNVKPTSTGFLVSGYVNALSDRDRVQRIAQTFPQTTVGDVYVIDELLGSARLYFSDTPLTVTYGGHGTLLIGGSGGRSLQQRVANFAKDARPALQVVDRVVYAGAPQTAPKQAPPTAGDVPDIVGVYGDGLGTRFIETSDGARYFEGSRLPGGLEVRQIGNDRVIFARGPDRFFMDVSSAAVHEFIPPPPG
ncbi:FHA domain-containing protein [Trinickia dinghuensis]|uniref:EscD/YscD/HrpQ family type III secretion system inner membrane ring protein n=1 Tax=Trinickia dinghuensis TaxID=2291023 RepID=A0A3D8JYV6_9BURK|nr:FHA domain-containing protein [Trinickia dinghuensis]RDU98070.1 EscD/YscD/HrpQ family type III secretion system inner membrane ring protein [Trinickia dinghuensis]